MDMMQRLYLMLPWAPWVFIVSVSITVCIVIPLIKVKSPYNFIVAAICGIAGYFILHLLYFKYHQPFDSFFSNYVIYYLYTDIFVEEVYPIGAMMLLFPIYMVIYKLLEQGICRTISILTKPYDTIFFNVLRIILLFCFVGPILYGALLKPSLLYIIAPIIFALLCLVLPPLTLLKTSAAIFSFGLFIVIFLAVLAFEGNQNARRS